MAGEECANLGVKKEYSKRSGWISDDAKLAAGGKTSTSSRVMPGSQWGVWLSASQDGS